MKNRPIFLTTFVLFVFCLHTVRLGFAQGGSTETPEKQAYRDAVTNLGTKDRKLMKIKTDLTASKSSIEKIDGKLSAAEVARLGNVALVAAAILSGTAATAIAAKTAAGIVAGKNVAEIINTAIEDKGLQATLKELQQGAYDLETEVIDQTAVVQTQAERVNEKLAAWEKALPEGEKPIFDDEEAKPIDVASKFPDHTREIDPPSQSEASTETQACRGCMESLQPPYDDTTIIPPDPISQQAVKINKKVYRDHGVVCAETRHSTGKTCEGGLYFTCPNPNAGTVTACRYAADHRIVGPCPEGEEKHTYAAGSPGKHGQRVRCGSVGQTAKQSDGSLIIQVCHEMVWECARHGSHTWSRVSVSAENICPECGLPHNISGSGSGSGS